MTLMSTLLSFDVFFFRTAARDAVHRQLFLKMCYVLVFSCFRVISVFVFVFVGGMRFLRVISTFQS